MKKKLTFVFAILTTAFTFATNHTVNTQANNTFSPSSLIINVVDSVTFVNTAGSHNVNGTLVTYANNPEGFENPTGVSAGWTYIKVLKRSHQNIKEILGLE